MARIRSSARTKQTAQVRVVDFRHLWRQLRAAGWKSKKPVRLATEWTYFAPNAGGDGLVEGTNVFTGEDAVVRFAIVSGLINLHEGSMDPNDDAQVGHSGNSGVAHGGGRLGVARDGGHSDEAHVSRHSGMAHGGGHSDAAHSGEHSNVACDAVSSSQIGCSLALSAPTLEALFEPCRPIVGTGDKFSVLQQCADARAFDIPQRALFPLGGPAEDVVAGSFQRMPSEVHVEPSDDEGKCEEHDTSSHVSEISGRVGDVNILKDDEDSDDYETISSSGSEAEDEQDTDDVERREYPDNDYLSDGEVALVDEAFIESLGGSLTIDDIDKEALRVTTWSEPCTMFDDDPASYPNLSDDMAAPIRELRDSAGSPLALFLYFLPKSLWIRITEETNRYRRQQIESRATRLRSNQLRARRTATPETLQQMRRRLRAEKPYETSEILQVIGLLVAHMLCPQTRRFSGHWSMTDDGAIPTGIFGRFMARNRCTAVLGDLHFADNEVPRVRDRMWKLRQVVDVLQDRCLSAWTLPAVFSFDEGVLPSTSRRNTTRMFMPDKPHRYGTKMFMVCDSKTAYCHHFEIYVGARERDNSAGQAVDNKMGAAAVVRNMKTVLGEHSSGFRLVVIDRFYSSLALALELLAMSIYVIGTIATNRIGFDARVVEKRKTRPRAIERGTFTFSRCIAAPTMVACHWWDRKPVHYLATGVSMTEDRIQRNVKQVGPVTVRCPKLVTDYQRWMGGVDVHDQLRLQSYSIQTSFRFRKYYKSLFLGFVDIAIVNAYITHEEASRLSRMPATSRGDWMGLLHKQLLPLKPEDFEMESSDTPLAAVRSRTKRQRHSTHKHVQFDDWVTVSGVQKRRQRSCGVRALLRGQRKKSFQTTFFCEDCSNGEVKLFLCPKARREYKGISKTCFQIWHDDFDCGEAIPETLGKRIVLRRPG